ncbi:MAG: RHS repeat-associated core domain-containing protein, partial [Treponema sp.]|nr:RHS repeat-associated core domain-containing protein [Treponema sp.]
GNEYQRLEYTPYGELWIEKTSPVKETKFLPYKFTGKERDEETGLYYYGARYLDAKYSRWLSADPALGEYMGGTSSGEGGIFNTINFNLYHYAGNNPIKYIDPDGRKELMAEDAQGRPIAALNPVKPAEFSQHMFTPAEGFEQGFEDTACNATAALNVVSIQYTKETGKSLSYAEGIDIMKNNIGDTDKGQVFIKKTDATVTDIASAVGSMAKYINKKQGENIFAGRFWYSKKSSEDYAATYRIDVMDSVNYPSHFVNNEGDNKSDSTKINILDTYDGKHKTRLKTERQRVNEFYYIVPKKQEE